MSQQVHNETISYARDDATVKRCWDVFKELRPHLNETEFLKRWRQQSSEGYQIVYMESEAGVVAAAGFRVLHTMAGERSSISMIWLHYHPSMVVVAAPNFFSGCKRPRVKTIVMRSILILDITGWLPTDPICETDFI